MNAEYAYYTRLQPWSDIQTQMPLLLEIASGYPEAKILELGVPPYGLGRILHPNG